MDRAILKQVALSNSLIAEFFIFDLFISWLVSKRELNGFIELGLGLEFAITRSMRLHKKILFILSCFLVHSRMADSSPGAEFTEVQAHRRAQHAQRILGAKEFRRIADFNGTGVDIKTVVYERLSTQAKKLSPVQVYALTETVIRDSNQFKMDPLFVLAIIEQESRFNPAAKGLHGEIGLMQILPDTAQWTAKRYGLKLKKTKFLNDPILNVRIGIRYLDWLSRQFDSPRLSTAAYNMGVRNVQKLLARKKQPEVYFNQVLGKYTRLYEETSFQAKLKDGRTSSIFVAGD